MSTRSSSSWVQGCYLKTKASTITLGQSKTSPVPLFCFSSPPAGRILPIQLKWLHKTVRNGKGGEKKSWAERAFFLLLRDLFCFLSLHTKGEDEKQFAPSSHNSPQIKCLHRGRKISVDSPRFPGKKKWKRKKKSSLFHFLFFPAWFHLTRECRVRTVKGRKYFYRRLFFFSVGARRMWEFGSRRYFNPRHRRSLWVARCHSKDTHVWEEIQEHLQEQFSIF